jgi:hypothetical protein
VDRRRLGHRLHLGRQTRPHDDIDVLVLRADLPAFDRQSREWDLHAADPPGHLRPWPRRPSETRRALPTRVHDVWCRRTATGPWQFQLMISNTEDGHWIYRRDPRIRRPMCELAGPASIESRPVLAPEIQLLHKSARPRAKDTADFHATLPTLTHEQREWLRTALVRATQGHPWINNL